MPRQLRAWAGFSALLRWKDRNGLLKTVFLSGVFLVFLTGGALIALALLRPGTSAPEALPFYQALREYDRAIRQGGETPERLDRMLAGMTAESEGLEPVLSVLKRRRALARAYPRFLPQYQEAVRSAAAAWPYSEPLAALAAAALVQNRALDGNAAAELRARLPLLASAGLGPLRVSLHVVLGDFRDPRTAAAARLESGLAAALPRFRARLDPAAAESLIADLAILKLLDGDAEGAAAEIQAGLYENPRPSPEFIRFAAEYFYDYRDPLRAAELFSRLDTPADILRQADALWLSGSAESARHLWAILASPAGEAPAVAGRALYNLAASAGGTGEAAILLEQLIALPAAASDPTGSDGSAVQTAKFGRIRYSRLLSGPGALAVLEEGRKLFPGDPLLELELLRRRSAPVSRGESWEPDRVIGETWLLLGRQPDAEAVYQWGAWYFARQRRPAETAMLLKTAERQGIAAPWIALYRALGLAESGDPGGAEELLRAIPPESAGWEVFANLGRIREARRSPAEALGSYEIAASLVQDRGTAARIQLRIAGCLRALGRSQECRRVLEYALDLDPDNLDARLELKRLDQLVNPLF
jgi:tetratricopeptide (TPR) repeat protein